jgi:hypothetical protein
MPTLAQVEAEIVSRVGPWLTAAGKSAATDGANADLVGPISRAIRGAGGTVATLGAVTQPDLDTVDAGNLDLLLDLAEVYTLESLYQPGSSNHIKSYDYEEWFDSNGSALDRRIAALWKRLGAAYGIGQSTITAGVIDLNIGGHGCDSSYEYPY